MNSIFCISFFLSCYLVCLPLAGQELIFIGENGQVKFTSNAPLEVIVANSNELKGAVDIEKKTFAFSIKMNTFEGFNTPLQREHFNENYLETNKFPTASFTGKIIEDINLSVSGQYTIRAKGKFTIHGISQERIIKSTVKTDGDKISIKSEFSVLLAEHDIAIPKIVYQKIAEEIEVLIDIELIKK